jgi:hypothetical protein
MMDNKRRVGFLVLFNLLKGKKPYGIVGLSLIILSVLIALFIIPFIIGFKGENGSYDFSDIQKYGIEKNAKVTYLSTVHNLSINNVNPVIVTYKYEDNGNSITDRSETLDIEKIAGLNVGAGIKALVYNHQSIIKDVEPYFVPEWVSFIPVPVLIAGVLLLLIGLVPALKIYNLFKTGIIKDAFITNLGLDNNIPLLLDSKIQVNYYFVDDYQNKVYGESESNDSFYLMQKKPGDSIKIFVSKNDITKTCIVPIAEAAKYNWIA